MKIRGMGLILAAIGIMGVFNSCNLNGNYNMSIGDIFLVNLEKPSRSIQERIKDNRTIKDCKYDLEMIKEYLLRNNIEFREENEELTVDFNKENMNLTGFNFKFRESFKQDKWKLGREQEKWAEINFEIMFPIYREKKIIDYKNVNKLLEILYGNEYDKNEINRLLHAYNKAGDNEENLSCEVTYNLNNGWNHGLFKVEDGIVLISDSYTPFEGINIVEENYKKLQKVTLDDASKEKTCKFDNLSIYAGATESLGITRIGKRKGIVVDNQNFKYIIDENGVDSLEIKLESLKGDFLLISNEEIYQALNIYTDSDKEVMELFIKEIESAVNNLNLQQNYNSTVNKNNYVLEYNINQVERNMGIVKINLNLYKVTL